MALPVTISTVVLPANNGHGRFGPFKSSGGNFYIVLIQSSINDHICEVMKATDPTSSFSSAATSAFSQTVTHFAVYPNGDKLEIAAITSANSEGLKTFDMSTDTFTTASFGSDFGATIDDDSADHTVDISMRSDGDAIVVYSGDEDNDMGAKNRVDYARWEGSSWTSDIAVDDGGAVHYEGPGMVRGESDLMHIMFWNDTNLRTEYKNLNSSNSLSTVQTQNSAGNGTRRISESVYYDDGGVERVRVLMGIGSPSTPFSSEVNDGNLGSRPGVGDGNNFVNNNTSVITAALDGKTIHALWSGGASQGTDQDLYHDSNNDDAGWGTDIEELDGVTINAISANVYTRSGATVLAYVYDDGGTIKYNEIELAAAAGAIKDIIGLGIIPAPR